MSRDAQNSVPRLLNLLGLDRDWRCRGSVDHAEERDGRFVLLLMPRDGTALRVWLDPNLDGNSFRASARFRIGYYGKEASPAAIEMLTEVAEYLVTQDKAGVLPLPRSDESSLGQIGKPQRAGPIKVPFSREHLLARLPEALERLPSVPNELEIIVSNPCDMGCVFCPEGDLRMVGRASPFDADSEMQHLKFQIELNDRIGAKRLRINGNDPVRHPYLIDLIELGRSHGFSEICTETPGGTLGDQNFVKRLADAGLTLVEMVYYGHTEELFSSITGIPGSKARADRAVRNLLDAGITPYLRGIAIEQLLPHVVDIADSVQRDFGLPYAVTHYIPHQIDTKKHRYLVSYEQVSTAIARAPEAFPPESHFPRCLYPEALQVPELLESDCRPLNLYALSLPYDELGADWKPTLEAHYPSGVCDGCSLREVCPGTYQAYEEMHGTVGLRRV